MRAARIPTLVPLALALLLPAGSQPAESQPNDPANVVDTAPPALNALTHDFLNPPRADPRNATEAGDVSLAPKQPRLEAGAPPASSATAPAFSLTYDLPGGIKFTPLGRLEEDSVWVTQSPLNKATVGDLQNTTGFRRARIGAKLEITENVEWMSEFDFSNAQFRITNVYIGLTHLPVIGELRVGQFREPFSLEAQTSSNCITFMERAENNSLVPGREWGAALFIPAADRQGTLSLGVFRSGSSTFGKDASDQNDLAYTVRGTRLFWFDDADDRYHLIHLGGEYSFRRPPGNSVTFNIQKGILGEGDSPLDPLLTAPVIPANQEHSFGVELASVVGPVSVQAEWTAAYVPQLTGNPVFYDGAYVYASFFLTGEHRTYDLRKGAFGPMTVLHPFRIRDGWDRDSWPGMGAWELAVRYSYLNLNDSNAPLAPTGLKPGGELEMLTFGLNWYLNDHTRVMLNYSPTIVLNPNAGRSYAEYFGARFAAFW